MTRAVVMGLGNPDRGDDGVAFHVVNRLRRRLGAPPLDDGDTGLGAAAAEAAVLFFRQLVPELVLDVGGCSRLVFVDAHVPAEPRAIVCSRIGPQARWAPGLTHALPPEGFLWLLQAFAGRAPESFLVSVRGERFDFTRKLSPTPAALVDPAAGVVLNLIRPNADHRFLTDHPREV
ncbi:MAG: hydrogenase maturation protease [Desulfobacterales bacterium]|jgi:hydrogenase maturation protease|nr:hydrogenase maturation protease [Desulfobacterales bacterium]